LRNSTTVWIVSQSSLSVWGDVADVEESPVVREAVKSLALAREALEKRPRESGLELEVERSQFALGFACRAAVLRTRLKRVRVEFGRQL
jgi:hypothetical protein